MSNVGADQAVEALARRPAVVEESHVRRFSTWQVIQHGVLMVSFTGLALTGLPQKYARLGVSRWFIGLLGGIEWVRILHHWFAFALGALAAVHLVELGVRAVRYGLRSEMWPSINDVRDLMRQLRYFMGLEPSPPRFGRYSFKEKFEYWAVIWGTAIMGMTGLVLLYPEIATRFLPGVVVPASRAAHGGEGVLAVLAILLWHMYNAHLRPDVFPMDTVIFTGRISTRRMEEEHPLELERMRAAASKPGREGGP